MISKLSRRQFEKVVGTLLDINDLSLKEVKFIYSEPSWSIGLYNAQVGGVVDIRHNLADGRWSLSLLGGTVISYSLDELITTYVTQLSIRKNSLIEKVASAIAVEDCLVEWVDEK